MINSTNTYSIIAFDPESKQMGAAMQTHNFEACNGVIWTQPGVGVIASQAGSDPFYAFAGFEMLRLGKTVQQTLDSLVLCDPNSTYNQVAIIDVQGNVAAYTGESCLPEAGHRLGQNYSCQANIMLKDTVWGAMAAAFESSQGELVDRLMTAMEAAEKEGGDIRGAQSAVIKVVSAEQSPKPWLGHLYDLRVYDSPEPLKELRRLIATKKAHEQTQQALNLLSEKNLDDQKIASSMTQFQEAVNKIPNLDSRLQYQCYYGLTLFQHGQVEQALALLKTVFAANPTWREVVLRIARVGPDNAFVQNLDEILAQ